MGRGGRPGDAWQPAPSAALGAAAMQVREASSQTLGRAQSRTDEHRVLQAEPSQP